MPSLIEMQAALEAEATRLAGPLNAFRPGSDDFIRYMDVLAGIIGSIPTPAPHNQTEWEIGMRMLRDHLLAADTLYREWRAQVNLFMGTELVSGITPSTPPGEHQFAGAANPRLPRYVCSVCHRWQGDPVHR